MGFRRHGLAVQCKGGKRADLGGKYFRSAWEANYARYLNFCIKHPDLEPIAGWKYEAEVFSFPVKRGTTEYRPDFIITMLDDSVVRREVKGYMTKKGATALGRMKKYHPDEPIELVDRKVYTEIKNNLGGAIPGWEW